MNTVSLIAIFLVVWWVVLFAVLPWGMRSQEEEGEVVLGSMPGAPHKPRLVRKVIVTTVVAAIVTLGIWYVVGYLGYDVDAAADFFLPRK